MLQFTLGEIKNPLGQDGLNTGYGDLAGNGGLGPLDLLSNVFQLVAVAAGLFALVNLIMAGMKYISSAGDAGTIEEAQKQMNMSLIGIIIVVMSFVIAALVGQLLFGDPAFIFNPKVYGPGTI